MVRQIDKVGRAPELHHHVPGTEHSGRNRLGARIACSDKHRRIPRKTGFNRRPIRDYTGDIGRRHDFGHLVGTAEPRAPALINLPRPAIV